MTDANSVQRPQRHDRSALLGRRRVATTVLLAASVVAVARFLVGLYTDQIWFRSVGAGPVWERLTTLRLGLSFGAFVVTLLIIWLNLAVADRMGSAAEAERPERPRLNVAGDPPLTLSGRVGRWPRVCVAFVIASIASPIVGSRWQELTLLLFRSPHSTSPIRVLGVRADVSVFVLPFCVSFIAWLITVLVVCSATCVASYVLGGAIRRLDQRFVMTEGANTHLSVLLASLCLSVGVAMWLARFGLAVGQRGSFVGLMYTDRTVRVPAYTLLAMAAAVVAGSALSNARSRRWSIPAVGVVCWIIVAGITLGIAPFVVDDGSTSGRTSGSTSEKESVFLDDHIEATLFAYDLDKLDLSASIGSAGLSRAVNVSQVVSGTNVEDDPVGSRVDLVSGSTLFGKSKNRYEITKSKQPNPPKTGISLSNPVTRVAFGLRFGDVDLIRGAKVSKGSALAFRQNVIERARAVAPFLRFDSRPYPVELNNRKLWIVDAYTTSDRFPGAQRHALSPSDLSAGTELGDGFNYVRNSVRVVVDAADGTTLFYRTDPTDQIIATWARVFPKLFRPAPYLEIDYPGISGSLRYPSDLLAIQASVFGTYRHSSPAALRDGTRRWLPSAQGPIDPALEAERRIRSAPMYRLVKLPGESVARFTITQTLETVVGTESSRVTAMLSGRTNTSGLNTLTFTPIVGRLATPSDVGEIMADDPSVVSGLASFGSKKVFGQVQVIPVDTDRLIYVRKVFVQPSNTLVRVLVFNGTHVFLAKTVEEALLKSVSAVGTADQEVVVAMSRWEAAKEALRKTGDVVTYQKSVEDILNRLSSVPKDTPPVQ